MNQPTRLHPATAAICCMAAAIAFHPTLTAAEQLLYVSPGGNDAWSGSLPESNAGKNDGPLATLKGARQAVRARIADGLKGPITVNFRGGEYALDQTVVFGPEDSGTAECPITYQAFENDKPVFTGGKKIEGWKPVEKDPEGMSKAAKGKLWYWDMPADLKGKWQITSLYNGIMQMPRAQSPQYQVSKEHQPDEPNAQPKDLRGFADKKKIDLLNHQGDPVVFRRDFKFNVDNLKDWRNVKDVEIIMSPKHGWLINILPLERIDVATKTATFTVEPTYGIRPANKYTVHNVIDFLDEPGEWVFNSLEGRVYYWPEKPVEESDIRAPCLQEFIRVEGVEDGKPVRHLTFKGLTFRHGLRDTWLPGDKGLQHDWEMYDKGNAVLRLRHAEHCTITKCTFEGTAGTGVRLDLHCQHNTVSDSEFSHIGSNAIVLSGYAPGTKDVNKHNTVANNYIHHVGEMYKHGTGVLIAQSGHNLVSHNTIHDLAYNGMVISGCRPHELAMYGYLKNRREWVSSLRMEEIEPYLAAIKEHLPGNWINSGIEHFEALLHARKNIIEYNEIYRVMLELHDGNGIYYSGMGEGNITRYNYIHDTHTTMGFIRLDDNSGFTYIRNNVFVDGISMQQIKWDCEYINNFAINVKNVMGRPWHPTHQQKMVFYNDQDPEPSLVSRTKDANREWSGEWSGEGDQKTNIALTASNSLFFFPQRKNEFIEGRDYMPGDKKGGAGVGLIFGDPLFDKPAFEQKIFRFLPGSPALKLGIEPIDLSKVGSTLAPNNESPFAAKKSASGH